MTRTKAADTKGRETNGKRRESKGKARGQMKKIIKGILGVTGKDRMYEEKGEGRRKKGPAGQDKTKTEDKTAGPDGSHDYLAGRSQTGGGPPTTTTAH
jgi:hypothetical protein